MNKYDFEFMVQINELFKKIPTISTGGAGPTVSAEVFIASATDLRIGREFYIVAIESFMHEQIWQNYLKYRDDIDIDDAKEQIQSYKKLRIDAVRKLKEFIDRRINENWCKPSLSEAYEEFA